MIKRFNGTIAELFEMCSFKLKLVEQNLETFRIYGITESEVESSKKLLTEFSEFNSDKLMLLNQVGYSIQKSTVKQNLQNEIMLNLALIQNFIPNENQQLMNLLEIKNIKNMNCSSLLLSAERLINAYSQNKHFNQELDGNNVSKIKELTKKLNDLDAQHDITKSDRRQTTAARMRVINEVFNHVQKYCKLGKAIFVNNPELAESFNLYKYIYRRNIKPQEDEVNSETNS